MTFFEWLIGNAHRRNARSPQYRSMGYESLEDRKLLATYTVDTNFGGTLQTGQFSGSLRWAIAQTNNLSDLDQIVFDLDSTEFAEGITLDNAAITTSNPVQILGDNNSSPSVVDLVTIRAKLS